jgi:hypothetical protein
LFDGIINVFQVVFLRTAANTDVRGIRLVQLKSMRELQTIPLLTSVAFALGFIRIWQYFDGSEFGCAVHLKISFQSFFILTTV